MTDQEINEEVAKRLGWIYHKDLEPVCWEIPESKCFLRGVPDYCHSIEAAWELIEKFEWFCLNKNHEGGWSIFDMAGTEEATLISEADTPPMAICLAFLKLK